MTVSRSALDDPDYAAFAWGRYRKVMIWMVLASLFTAAAGAGVVWYVSGPVPWLMLLLTAAGIFFTVLLAAALMGLVFLSSGTGHDEAIVDPFDDTGQ